MTVAYYNCIFKNIDNKNYSYISYQLKIPNQFNVPSRLKLTKHIKNTVKNSDLVHIAESTQPAKNYKITELNI